jgi:hypothetical protein
VLRQRHSEHGALPVELKQDGVAALRDGIGAQITHPHHLHGRTLRRLVNGAHRGGACCLDEPVPGVDRNGKAAMGFQRQ